MEIFFTLFSKIIYLYFLIGVGVFAGKKLNVKKEKLAPILIYGIAPVVFFNSIIKINIIPQYLLLPVIFFVLCSCIGICSYFIGGKLFKDSTRNLLALSSGTANTGYFGIPIADCFCGQDVLGIIVLGILGFGIYECSLGFYMIALGKHSPKEAFFRVLKLPTLYAILLGLVMNYLHVHVHEGYILFSSILVQIYTVIGMMIIGLGLADMKRFEIDKVFLTVSFLIKFIIWPLVIVMLILLDKQIFHLFNFIVYKVMILLSIVPLAANTVAFATEFNAKPDKASSAVLLSTLFAMIYIPVVIVLVKMFL